MTLVDIFPTTCTRPTRIHLLIAVSMAGLVFMILAMILPTPTYAADWSIVCSQTSCTPTSTGTFLPTTPWMPGQTVSRTIEVANQSDDQRISTLRLSGIHQTKNLIEVVQVRISNGSNRRTIWNGSLSALLGLKSVELLKVGAGEVSTYQFQFTVDKAAGNQYQQAQLSFDLDITLTEVAGATSTTTQPKATSQHSESSNRATSTTYAGEVAGLSLQRFFGNLITGSLSLPDSAVVAAGLAPAAAAQAAVGQLAARSTTWIWMLILEVLSVYAMIWKLRNRTLIISLTVTTLVSASVVAWLTRAPLPIILTCIPGLVGIFIRSEYLEKTVELHSNE